MLVNHQVKRSAASPSVANDDDVMDHYGVHAVLFGVYARLSFLFHSFSKIILGWLNGTGGARTLDLRLKRPLLCQLSYDPC